MKKSAKIAITILITVALYALFYSIYVTDAQTLSVFIVVVAAGLVGIPIGAGLSYILQKKKVEQKKANLVIMVVALVYGFLLGWISLTGMIIGQFLVEK